MNIEAETLRQSGDYVETTSAKSIPADKGAPRDERSMSSESGMTIVTALTGPHVKDHVVRALHELPEFPGCFFLDARGRGAGGFYAASESDLRYQHFLQLQIACRPDQAGAIRSAIAVVAWTGRQGDGVIFTTDATSFVRIRERARPNTGATT